MDRMCGHRRLHQLGEEVGITQSRHHYVPISVNTKNKNPNIATNY